MERLISIVFYNRSKRFRSIYDIMIISYGEKEISQEINNMSKVISKNDIILTHIILDGKPYDGKLSRTVWIGGKSNINSCTYDEYVDFNK